MPILRIVAIVAMVLSASQGAKLLLASSHSVSSTIMAIITVAVLTTGLCVLSEIAFLSLKVKKHGISVLAGCLVAVLYMLSVSGQAFSWITDHRKESSRLEIAQTALSAKNADVANAEQQLSRCNPAHVTKCIKPAADNLAIKQIERDKAVAELALLSEAAGVNNAWADFNAWLGLSERKQSDIEFNRDMILAAFVELLAIIFYANPYIIRDLTEEVKKNTVTVQQMRIDSPQPDIIPTQQPVEYQPPVVANEWVNFEQQQSNFVQDAYKSDLMKTIDLKTDVLVCSPIKGSGKSAIAALFARMCKAAGHRVIVIDINFKRNAENTLGWYLDDNIEVIGAKGNYREITAFFNGIRKEIADRHNRDDMNYPQITIIVDEMVSLVDNIDSDVLATFLKTALSNGRQLKINLMFCTHADTIEGTGLKGITALKDGLSCELMPFFEIDDNGNKVYLVRKTATFVTATSKKPIKKSEIYYHPGVIVANWRTNNQQPDFKPVIDSIVNVSPKVLKKNLNDDMFSLE